MEDLEKYRLAWKLHLMRNFYQGLDGKDLDTKDEKAFVRWVRARQQEEEIKDNP